MTSRRAGECVDCADNGDCPMGQSCFPENHECHEPCANNADCTMGESPLCDPATGACVGCLDAADCDPDNPICSSVTQQCSECDSSDDCAGGEVCDVEGGECRECLVDAHCPPGDLCIDNDYRDACTTNADCGGDTPFCLESK